jgi:tRNA-dihydrouridine synthase C
MLQQTKCDALMIGRGSVINPFIFHQIKSHFAGQLFEKKWEVFENYIQTFVKDLQDMSLKGQISKLKQLMSFLFKGNSQLKEKKQQILTFQTSNLQHFLSFSLEVYQKFWLQECDSKNFEFLSTEPDLCDPCADI